jgi:hypothetical protein
MRRAAFGAVCLVVLAVPAAAQTASVTPAKRWEIEGYGGLSRFNSASTAPVDLPLSGAPITTSSPIVPSRQVPSWFFGDGASLLNAVNAEFALAARITPLDAALGAMGISADGSAFGARIRRRMSKRVSAEISFDALPSTAGADALPPQLQQAAQASRASFETAFGALLASGPFTNVSVSATTSTTTGSSREIAATGNVRMHFGSALFEPYVTLGAGVISRAGDLPSLTLQGNYRGSVLSSVPINETDTVTLRYSQRPALVGVAGAGIRRNFSDRWGLTLDARALIGRQSTRLLIDAAPTVTTGSPAGFIESFTHPSIQFSNNTSTGRQSSLSTPGLDGFVVSRSSSTRARYLVSLGIFLEF